MDFSLEKWQPSFAGSVTESANDARVARFLRDSFPYPYTRKNAEDFIAFAQGETERGEYYRAIVVGGKAVGGAQQGFPIDGLLDLFPSGLGLGS